MSAIQFVLLSILFKRHLLIFSTPFYVVVWVYILIVCRGFGVIYSDSYTVTMDKCVCVLWIFIKFYVFIVFFFHLQFNGLGFLCLNTVGHYILYFSFEFYSYVRCILFLHQRYHQLIKKSNMDFCVIVWKWIHLDGIKFEVEFLCFNENNILSLVTIRFLQCLL